MKRDRGWRTFKRPGVDAFLEHLAQFYEIVVYSDQLSMVCCHADHSVECLVIVMLYSVTDSMWGMCSMLILLLKDWTQSNAYGLGYQGLQLNIKTRSTIEYVYFL